MTTTTTTPPHERDLNSVLIDIDSRQWKPRRGTLGHALMLRVRGHSDAARLCIVQRFARLAIRRQGLWWAEVLELAPGQVHPDDRAFALALFDAYLDEGARVFRRSRR